MTRKLEYLNEIERCVSWLAAWTIHHANHVREGDEIKVGGHQASSASLSTIMTALYGSVLRPQDRVAVKPHAAPIFHALQYLAGNQTHEKLMNFRGYKGAQSYPSRTKDVDDVDFSTGSVGLGVAQTLFSSLVQDYVSGHGWMKERAEGRMVSLIGDAEMDEGNIYEALIEGWKHGLRNCWWVVDYNRQSLDAVIREGLWQRFEQIFRNFGWDVMVLRHGALQEAAFAEPGGEKLLEWIERCPNQLYSALTFQGGAAWRKRLLDEIGDQGRVTTLIERRSDDELQALMTNLGGHDMPSLLEAFEAASKHDRPVCFICYTIKGYGLPLAGHKDNHAGQMTPTQMEDYRLQMGVKRGEEWDKWAAANLPEAELDAFFAKAPFFSEGRRRLSAPSVPVPETLPSPGQPGKPLSTQMGFGQILNDIARERSLLADRIVTTSPDVTVSTNLGGWVNRRGLFARETMADTFKAERIPSTFTWEFGPKGQHLELGIAESNLMIMLGALGLSHSINGVRLLPIGTVYDPFIYRSADQLNYACYQDARFMLVATPSGVTLAPEGGAHQSIGTPLIGMAQDGLCAFEPAFVDELSVIMRFAFDYMQRNGEGNPDETTWLRDQTGGSVYLRLSTRPLEQPLRDMKPALARDIVNGAYWLRPPGPNASVVIAYQGVVAPEAIAATGLLAEDRRDVGLLAITSADRLNAGWQAAERARQRGAIGALSHIERLLAPLSRDCGIVTVIDGHPATLAWLGGVNGHRVKALGVEHFGQTGTIADLYRHHGLDTNAIVHAAQAVSAGPAVRYRKALP
ncbi:transketolase [Mesorhizobium sp. C416B]|uniref:transketolase n=1 Tax=unclassified Mesorhizobium TaxID=325217 RepID=UPI0003CE03C2|nr:MULTISPECIES: transketolase [unclassified Mesorhizobium]ESX46839.1 transketolase [Mesorhizobium sp. LSHC426A00]ESX56764.1 transketolase [Mesorhizobium sp. LSHC422A00]ESX58526.1 transketolase [Mesorhizobium sp. LSHC424B00]ESX71878.1 transketolase [Mesorhizobium sp. LSHC416B00]ESX78318.1 transketolase [Mesorhizobium sp. LSHC414A00]